MKLQEDVGHGMDFLDQYGIQLFGDSSDDDETYLVSNPRKIKATAMREYIIHVMINIISVAKYNHKNIFKGVW